MKIKIFFFILLLQFNFLYAENPNEIKESLPSLIEKMKKADVKERYIYMNKIKMILKNMNQQKRAEIIKELRKSFAKGKNDNILHKGHHKFGNFKNHEMSKGHKRQGHGRH